MLEEELERAAVQPALKTIVCRRERSAPDRIVPLPNVICWYEGGAVFVKRF